MEMTTPKYRVFWTWDYGTFWDDSEHTRGRGCFGPNQRRAKFLDDYMRMVDFCADHGINGIVIWGALRAYNNGAEQLRKLASYGAKKGVRILPGCGIFGYGGICYDPRPEYDGNLPVPMGRDPHSLHTWLTDHPEYRAIGPDGQPYENGPYTGIACPSRRENLDWFKDSLAWLLSEFEIGGVQVEIGDYGVCYCDECTRRRQRSQNWAFDVGDMIGPYTAAVETAKRVRPDAWVICETYSSFAPPMGEDKPGSMACLTDRQKDLLAALPQGAIVQWMMDRGVGHGATQRWEPGIYLPSQDNIARIHAGSQWTVHGPEEWAIHPIGDLVRRARRSGVNGVSIFGEESPASPPNEANYLVFSEFSGFGNENPACDLDRFYTQTLDPLFGGSDMARQWERIFVTGHLARLGQRLTDWRQWEPIAFHPIHISIGRPEMADQAAKMATSERREQMLGLIAQAHDISSSLSGESCRRWSWLENWLWRAEYVLRTEPR